MRPEAGTGNYRPEPVSFVRRGSRLQGRRQQAWDEYAPQFVIDVPRLEADTSVDPAYLFDAKATFGREAKLVVEIGSGLGEAIVHAARTNPDTDFLAVEVYRPGLAQTLQKAGPLGLTNLRLIEANAPEVLATTLSEGTVDELWVFFPDPWHKTRHHKRRLVKDSLVPLAARVLKDGGTWRLATDWVEYAAHIAEVLRTAEQFENQHPDTLGLPYTEDGERIAGVAPRFAGRILTSFENKAREAGREATDFELVRTPRP
nr:tRNA (guanosine(46)-N7)-methyltransferase TrmB [Haematomicrobium sanguinis]